MHFDLIDVYRPHASLIHSLDARVKILAAVLLILTAVLLPDGSWTFFLVLLVFQVGLSMLARLGWSFTLRRAFVALPFVLAALPLPFITPGSEIWVVPGLGWTVTAEGWVRFVSILLRTWLAVQAGILLSATTSAADLLWGLQALGMPRLLVGVVGFMLRYIFVLADEALRMLRARSARSPKQPGSPRPGFAWQGRVAGMMVGTFFLRALERSERVFAAMSARGYAGEIRLMTLPVMKRSDWIALTCLAAALLGVLSLALGG